MPFKITVEEITVISRKKSVLVGKGEKGANEYGYRQEVNDEDNTTQIYTQQTDTLDLVAVITAVNKKQQEDRIKSAEAGATQQGGGHA